MSEKYFSRLAVNLVLIRENKQHEKEISSFTSDDYTYLKEVAKI